MKRVAKILLWISGGIFAICFVLAGILYVANLKNVRKAAADKKLCDSRLAQLEHDLPLGTQRDAVVSYLQSHGIDPLLSRDVMPWENPNNDVYVDLGRVQSTAWYCNYFEHYADLAFTTQSAQGSSHSFLSHVSSTSRPLQCL
jgi:hypothetical protein